MSIEEVFSSKGRVKILKLLVEVGELNITEIAKRVELSHSTANQHLSALERFGLVRHKRFGRIRIYRFNEESPKSKMIKELIESWEHLS